MTNFVFTIPGPLYAYRRIRDHGSYKNYDAFKRKVLLIAMEQGFRRPDDDEQNWYALDILVYWKKTPRIDASNVLKAVEDALFRQDRYVLEVKVSMKYNTKTEERALVSLAEYAR